MMINGYIIHPKNVLTPPLVGAILFQAHNRELLAILCWGLLGMCMDRTDTSVWSTRVFLTTERELCDEVSAKDG